MENSSESSAVWVPDLLIMKSGMNTGNALALTIRLVFHGIAVRYQMVRFTLSSESLDSLRKT